MSLQYFGQNDSALTVPHCRLTLGLSEVAVPCIAITCLTGVVHNYLKVFSEHGWAEMVLFNPAARYGGKDGSVRNNQTAAGDKKLLESLHTLRTSKSIPLKTKQRFATIVILPRTKPAQNPP